MASEVLTPEIVTDDQPQAPPATPEQIAADVAALAVQPDNGKKSVGYDGEGGIQILSMADALSWGKAVINSRLAPAGFRLPSQVIVAVQTGRELGLGPAAALRAMYLTPQGKAALYAEAALALCMKSGLLTRHRHEYTGEGDALTCTFYVLRKGDPEWKSASFSVAEARQAQLSFKGGSNWSKWPKRMTLARARAFCLHDNFADVLLGCPVEGDLDDLTDDPPAPSPVPESAPPRKAPGGFGLLDKLERKGPDAASAEVAPAAGDGPTVPAGVASPPPDAPKPSCDHAPVREYAKKYRKPAGKIIACEACALSVKLMSDGSAVVVEEPPKKAEPKATEQPELFSK